MTACVNRKHTKKVAAVVTASLVGALSLGVAPVAAMAEGIDMMSVQPVQELVSADNGQGDDVAVESGKTVKLEAESGQYLRPTGITDGEGNDLDLDDYTIEYHSDANGTVLKTLNGVPVTLDVAEAYFNSASYGAARTAAGKEYWLVIKKGSEDVLKVKFTYVAETLEGVFAYENNSTNPSDTSDTTFVYDGTPLDIKFAAADGTPLPSGYTYEFFYENSQSLGTGTQIIDAGSYVCKVKLADGRSINVPVTVEALDLGSASVKLEDPKGDTSVNTRANLLNALTIGTYAVADHTVDFQVTSVKAPDGGVKLGSGSGQYTVTIAPTKTASDKGNVTGTATITYYVLDNKLADTDFFYGANDFTAPLNLSLADGDAFDESRLKVVYNDVNYRGDQLEVTYEDGSGKIVDADALTKPGTYKVNVRLKAFQDGDDKWTGGYETLTVNVSATSINADKGLTYTYNGKVVADNGTTAGLTLAYTGEDILPGIGTKVEDSDGNAYEAGTDYTIEVVNTKTHKKVDSIIAVGTYKVTVKPVTFQPSAITGWDLTVVVEQANFGTLKNLTGDDAVAYTGSELTVPGAWYTTLEENDPAKPVTDKDSNPVYAELPSDLYKVTKIEYSKTETGTYSSVKTIEDEGFYKVTIKLTDEASDNYKLNGNTFIFEVAEYGHFADVKPEKWYAKSVDEAYELGYVNGMSGTNLFAPEADITRADAVVILFNMAGGQVGNKDYQYSETTGFDTGFDDVNGKLYYAEALAWAHASGIANGYEGNFRPADKITREEFAALLANFAASKGEDVTSDASALDKVSDAGTVSEWATGSVAWAVENGIMGNGGDVRAQDSIIRAEVAAMAVNYQPENLTGMVRGDKGEMVLPETK